VNPDIKGRVVPLNMAMNDKDGVVHISNRGDSMDQVVSSASAPGTNLIQTRSVSIGTLRKEHPELEGVGFVKIDTEGYERVIVPALRDFFMRSGPSPSCRCTRCSSATATSKVSLMY